jgi:alpha-mannosidase
MKKRFSFFLFSLLLAHLNAQESHTPDNLFPVRSAAFYNGFATIVSGQKLDYPPVLQKGKLALQVVSGGEPIAFETEPGVKDPQGDDPRTTFIWEASMTKSSGDRPARFDFFINGEKHFTFTCPKNETENNWMIRQGNAELSFIATGHSDEKGSIFGYQFLTVSWRDFPNTTTLKLKIAAENATLPDTYTAYQNEVKPSIQTFALQAAKRQEGKLQQPVLVEYTHVGPPISAELFLDGTKQQDCALHLGLNKLNIWVDKVTEPRQVAMQLVLNNKQRTSWDQTLTLKPVRPFEVCFLPHSHVDIGFTHLQAEVEQLQWRNIEQGIALAKKTADYPEGARYKWNVEVLWAVDGYLKNASPATREAFFEAVKKGWIGLDALYGSELTGLQRPEELMHVTNFANQLEREQGIKIQSAMITDVPGYAWGIVPALAENDIKYFSIGPNHMPHKAHGGYQVGHTFEAWGDVPFYWEAPSGKNKVLFWMTRHGYSWFHDWLLGKMRYTGGTPILKFLGELDGENYPYDMVQIRYTLGDNGGPDTDMPEFVREWNETYEYPTFRIATTQEMFQDFEKRYADKIPTHRGDFSPYWEDGAASSALETATNRNTAEQLVQAETLWAMLGHEHFPNAEFDEAWTNVLLFSEHTWGAYSSKSDPDKDFARNQWTVKKGFADNAERQTKTLIDHSLEMLEKPGEAVKSFLVFNTCSWERSELVKIPAAWKVAGLAVINAQGTVLPTQTLSTGELAFMANKIPPFSAVRFRLQQKTPRKTSTAGAKASNTTLSNEWLTVRLDQTTGAIASIRHKAVPFDLVDTTDRFGFNEYWYTGADAANPRSSYHPVIKIKENGPLVASIVVTAEAPGANLFTREIQLASGTDRVDITNFVDKKKVLEDENLRFSFPFHVPDGQVRIDLAWALMQPEKDQLKGANKNFFCAQHFVDISNPSNGITWANLDAPLVETGEMQGQRWMSNLSTEPWLKTWQPSNRLFSWVMNNVWFVNYKGYQEGPVSFRYSMLPHKAFDSGDAKKFGIGLTQPLLIVPVAEAQKPLAPLLTLKGSTAVIVTSLKPLRAEEGMLLRLFNASDKPAHTSLQWGQRKPKSLFLSNQKEKNLGLAPKVIDLGPWEIITLKANY